MKDLNVSELRFLLGLIVSQLPKELCMDDSGEYLSDPDQIESVRLLYKIAVSLFGRIELPF